RSVSNLIERRRIDLAERFLDLVRVADGGRRSLRDKDYKNQERKVVEQLRQSEHTRTRIKPAGQFEVLDRKFSEVPPIRDLWDRAATFAREKKGKLDSRELYELAMKEFKQLLVDDQDQTAINARALFEMDGFHFLRDEQGKLKPT